MNNIGFVLTDDLCCSCGACAAVCPKEAICVSFDRGLFVPHVDDALCVNCRMCVEVCPSAQVDVQAVYGGHEVFSDKEEECYVAFAKDEEMRHLGTSGGVVSALVSELLLKKVYDKAYVLSYEKFDGTPAVIKPITNPQDVRCAVKSKYIPASVAEVIKDIVDGTIGRSVVVATPCQLLAVKKCLALRKQSDSNLLFIGLFCDKTLNYNIYNYYTSRYGGYDSLHFRDKDGNDWPGDTVLRKGGEKKVIDKRIRMSLKPFFQLNRCRYCFDKLNQLADISCGDCYIGMEQAREGKSSMVVRTEKGRMVVQTCESILNLKESSMAAIKQSQRLDLKKENYLRNCSPQGAFVLPLSDVSSAGKIDWSREEPELKMLRLGATATSRKEFKDIEKSINKIINPRKNSKIMGYGNRFMSIFRASGQSKKVLVDHAGFVNKGAELMLQSVVQQLEINMPKARIVVPQSVFYENLNYCHRHRILPLQEVYGGKKKVMKHFVYDKVLNKPWYITPDQIDVILDVGGFQFGDQWNHTEEELKFKALYYSSFTKKGRRIVFLPQAFGPFVQPLSIKLMETVYGFADLIYAREQTSYGFLRELFPDDGKIKLAPDFTCLSGKGKEKSVDLPGEYVVVVPNSRMITHTSSKVSSEYQNYLCGVVDFLTDKGIQVILLNHEGKEDKKLLFKVNGNVQRKVLILSDLDALEIKRVIGGAKLLISSRFHGAVSGLTQGVPVLCTSWSHKYIELLKDFGRDNGILQVNDLERTKEIVADALDHPDRYAAKEGSLDKVIKGAEEMWKEIFNIIS